jgi:hypothetical protein
MEWAPAASANVLYIAVSGEPPDKALVPRGVDPSLNVTVPVGTAPLPTTVAVKVTELPYDDVGKDDTTVIVTEPFVTDCTTVFEFDVK